MKQLPWILLGSAIFLYLLLFVPLQTAIFLHGDVSVYLLNAQRMLQGQVMYKDFFQFTPPGTELLYLGLFRLFGPRVWIPNLMLFALGLGMTFVGIAISRRVLRGWTAFLPGLLFLTCSFFNSLDATHHWYSVLAVMTALGVIIETRTCSRLAAVGILCGLASFFTQARGLLAMLGFAIFLVWDHRRKGTKGLLKEQACLAGTFLAAMIAENAYFVWKAGATRFFWCIVTFGIRYYPGDTLANTYRVYLLSPPPLRPWYGLPWLLVYLSIHVLVPLVHVLFLVRYWREADVYRNQPWDQLMLVNITGLVLFIGVAPAPSFFRLCAVSLPAWIIFVWFLTFPGKAERILVGLAWAFVSVMIVLEPLKVQRHTQMRANLSAGRAAFLDADIYERYLWISEHTHPGDFFFEADWADIYAALGLQNPAPVPFVTNTDYTPPEQVRDVVQALDTRPVRLVLWSLDLDIDATPGPSPAADHLHPLRVYLRSRYHVVKTFTDGDQLWERDLSPPYPVALEFCPSTSRLGFEPNLPKRRLVELRAGLRKY